MTGDWNPNELLGTQLGSCRLERVIGVGGVGAVYLAQQIRPRRQVAVKVLRRGPTVSPEAWQVFLERFATEADLAANLDHTNIVPIFEFGQQGETAFLVMPYLAHGTLADLLEHRGRLSLAETVAHIDQAAAALDHAHQRGLVHRDVKPSNLLLHPDGRLMLADFGIARPADPMAGDTSARLGLSGLGDPTRSEGRRPAGTPEYMAPEQIRGGPLTPATDVYALGSVAYAMLAGQPPFADPQPHMTLARQLHEPPQPLRVARPELPLRADETIRWALAKDPAARPPGAGIFAAALRRSAERSRPLSGFFARPEQGREAAVSAPRGLLRLAAMFGDSGASVAAQPSHSPAQSASSGASALSASAPSARAPGARATSVAAHMSPSTPHVAVPHAPPSAPPAPSAPSAARLPAVPRRANGTQPLPGPRPSPAGHPSGASAPRSPAEPQERLDELEPPALPTNLPLGALAPYTGQPTTGAAAMASGPAPWGAPGPRGPSGAAYGPPGSLHRDNTPTIFDAGGYQRAPMPGWPSPVRTPVGRPPRARRSVSALKVAAAALVAVVGFAFLLGGLNQVGLFAAPGAPRAGIPAGQFAPTATALPTPTPTIPPNWLRVTPTSFSLQCKGKSNSQDLVIRNLGNQQLPWHVEAPGYTGLNFSATDGTVAPGEHTTIRVTDVAWWGQQGAFSVVPDFDDAGNPASVSYTAEGCMFGGNGSHG